MLHKSAIKKGKLSRHLENLCNYLGSQMEAPTILSSKLYIHVPSRCDGLATIDILISLPVVLFTLSIHAPK